MGDVRWDALRIFAYPMAQCKIANTGRGSRTARHGNAIAAQPALTFASR